jgi:DNA-directed RNA polymerase I subunit RPA2
MDFFQISLDRSHVPVLLDGVVLGGIPENILSSVVSQLRLIKSLCNMQSSGSQKGIDMGPNFESKKWCIDPTMELACIPSSKFGGGAYPGLYMFTQPGRLIRQVHQLHSHRIEWIGPMEQVYMEIACLADDVWEDTTHIELEPTAMLSHIAAMTPYSDYNQVQI